MTTPSVWDYEDPEHPRPVEVARLEAFLNTVDHHTYGEHAAKPADRRDLLTTPARLQRWLADAGLHGAGDGPVDDADLAAALRLREGLRSWLLARQGLEPDPAAVEAVGAVLARLPLQVRLGDGSVSLAPGDARGAGLARLVADLAMAQATGTLARLKICSAPDCRFAYYDRSRSRTSRWCSMETCGNRVKTRRYRERRRR